MKRNTNITNLKYKWDDCYKVSVGNNSDLILTFALCRRDQGAKLTKGIRMKKESEGHWQYLIYDKNLTEIMHNTLLKNNLFQFSDDKHFLETFLIKWIWLPHKKWISWLVCNPIWGEWRNRPSGLSHRGLVHWGDDRLATGFQDIGFCILYLSRMIWYELAALLCTVEQYSRVQ